VNTLFIFLSRGLRRTTVRAWTVVQAAKVSFFAHRVRFDERVPLYGKAEPGINAAHPRL